MSRRPLPPTHSRTAANARSISSVSRAGFRPPCPMGLRRPEERFIYHDAGELDGIEVGHAALSLGVRPTAKPTLPHARNMPSQSLSGRIRRAGLHACRLTGITGVLMSPENLAVLRTLALGPSRSIAPNLIAVVAQLELAGYVSHTSSGWMSTAKGCEAISEPSRTVAVVQHDSGRQAR